jgi:hypothetical protein
MEDYFPNTPRPRHASQIKKPLPPAPTSREIQYAISVGMQKVHSHHFASSSSFYDEPHRAENRTVSISKDRSYQTECEEFHHNESRTDSKRIVTAMERAIALLRKKSSFDPVFKESSNFNSSKESKIRPAERSER